MALNEYQREEARRLFSEGESVQDVYRHLGAKASGSQSPLDIRERALGTASKTPSRVNEFGSYIGQAITDVPQDVFTGFRQLGEGYLERYSRLKKSADALVNRQQTIGETATQFAANIAGGAIADPAYQLLRTGASFATTPKQEEKVSQFVGESVMGIDEKTGISDWYKSKTPREQRNIDAALDILDVAPITVIDRVRGMFGRSTQTQLALPSAETELQTAVELARSGQATADAARVVNNSVNPAAREKLVNDLATTYQNSLVGDFKVYNRRLQEQALDMSRGGQVVTQDDLIRALAEEGIVPDVRGKLADFTAEIRRIDERQQRLFEQYRPIIENTSATANVEDFRSFARESLRGRRSMAAELDTAEARLDRAINNIARSLGVDETGTLTAAQIDEISRIANDRTGAYRNTDVFEADVFSELSRAARMWLEKNVPDNSFRTVNDQWIRLQNIKTTAQNLQNAQIDVGLLGRAIGSYVTTIGATALAAPSGNPFLAVLAGLLTKMGGDEVANWMRGQKFSPEVRDLLQTAVLERDARLIEQLRNTATTEANRRYYESLPRQLPPASETPTRAPESQVIQLPDTSGRLSGVRETALPGAIREPQRAAAPETLGLPAASGIEGAPIIVGGSTARGQVQPGTTERSRTGAVRQPGGEPRMTELERRLAIDDMAVQQALLEMEVSITERPSVGRSNLVKDTEGEYYRFKTIPTWVPEGLRDGDLLDAVLRNIQEGKQPRANAGKQAELQRIVEERIKQRADEIKANGTLDDGSAGIFSNDAAFAAVLMAGGTYFLLSDSEEMLPVVAIGSMIANPAARRGAVKNAQSLVMKGKKLNQAYKRKIAEALETYDTTGETVDIGLGAKAANPNPADIRLKELQDRNESGTFTDADALEAEDLLAKRGVFVEPDLPKAEGATPSTNLLEEAKGKSLEEYIESQGKTVHHATDSGVFDPADFDVTKAAKGEQYFNPLGQGMYVSSNPDFVKRFGKNRMELVLPANAKIKTITQDEWLSGYGMDLVNEAFEEMGGMPSSISQTELDRVVRNAPIDALNQVDSLISQKEGLEVADKFVEALNKVQTKRNSQFDAIVYEATDYAFDADEIVIPDPSILKTRAQLEDIWKQANQ